MRLLYTDLTKGLRLETFNDPKEMPEYAILSHRWGDDEVLYKELMSKSMKARNGLWSTLGNNWIMKSGRTSLANSSDGIQPKELERRYKALVPDWDRFKKLIGCCWRAHEDGYDWVWIDTCCIDQKSSAELSESINSMFSLYARSAVCYAYLRHVPSADNPELPDSAFRKDEWFTRGWTLQELIAPQKVVFLTATWGTIGEKDQLARIIREITKINYGVLCGVSGVEDMSVAERMSWASNRKTTKVEDRAYSLLGIFGVHMTTIYGEGENAFQRLQYEIITQLSDHSIFAWRLDLKSADYSNDAIETVSGLLASSPDAFSESAGIVAIPHGSFAKRWGYEGFVPDVQKTTAGVHLELPLAKLHDSNTTYVMVLACKKPNTRSDDNFSICLALRLDPEGYYARYAFVGCMDADRLVELGTTYCICKIDVRSEIKLVKDHRTFLSFLEYMPKACQIKVKASTLSRLRDKHKIVLDQEQTTIRTFERYFPLDWTEDTSAQPVEQPVVEGKDFTMVFSRAIPDPYNVAIYKFCLGFRTPEHPFDISIYINGNNTCGWHEIDKDPSFDFHATILRPIRRWSKTWGNDGENVDITLIRTSVDPDMVSYELELEISGGQSSTLDEDASQQQGYQQSEAMMQDEIPVRWAPTCLGINPKGAYKHTIARSSCYFVRAYYKGAIVLGFLQEGDKYTTPFVPYVAKRAAVPSAQYICEYEILVGSPSLFRWIPVRGKFRVEALGGAGPVSAGLDADGEALYLVRVLDSDRIYIWDIQGEDENGDRDDHSLDDNTPVREDEGDRRLGAVSIGHFPRLANGWKVIPARRYNELVYNKCISARSYSVLVYNK